MKSNSARQIQAAQINTCSDHEPSAQDDWPLRAYVRPIRSVLIVDDQFPTYQHPENGKERERARELWSACSARGWLCDVDNATDWGSEEQRRRLSAADLIILDYQLAGEDPMPALNLIHTLAGEAHPNLVVIYTAEPDLDHVLIRAAAFARGIDAGSALRDLSDDVADLEGTISWSFNDLYSHIAGKNDWKRQFFASCKEQGIVHNQLNNEGCTLIERKLKHDLHAPSLDSPRRIEKIGRDHGRRWFQSGNLFVAIVGKPTMGSSPDEASALFTGLKESIRAWKPSWLACLIALSRQEGNQGSFRDDLTLASDKLRIGLSHYISKAEDDEDKLRRSRYVASDLLSRRFDAAVKSMGNHLLELVADGTAKAEHGIDTDTLVQVNAFLCSQRHDRHHLRIGTVFRTAGDGDSLYWVCVTPACDMVPRKRKERIDPWGASLGDTRPMTAVRLDTRVNKTSAIEKATEGRHLFFEDYTSQPPLPIVAAVFNTTTKEPNPKIEQMFAKNFARTDNGKVTILRVMADDQGVVSLQDQECIVVCQLRAPYAERLTHIVGGHISRIGVDFLSSDKGTTEEE